MRESGRLIVDRCLVFDTSDQTPAVLNGVKKKPQSVSQQQQQKKVGFLSLDSEV